MPQTVHFAAINHRDRLMERKPFPGTGFKPQANVIRYAKEPSAGAENLFIFLINIRLTHVFILSMSDIPTPRLRKIRNSEFADGVIDLSGMGV